MSYVLFYFVFSKICLCDGQMIGLKDYLGQEPNHINFHNGKDVNNRTSILINKNRVDDPQKQLVGIKEKKEGESCGSCYCPPTYSAGNCEKGLTCDMSKQDNDPDKPGTCKRKESKTSLKITKICKFSLDCQKIKPCQNLTDAWCVCVYGICISDGAPMFHKWGPKCERYTDCPCRSVPENCFCRYGICREERWECHEAADCEKMPKCKGLQCTCSGNRCEYECSRDKDCEGFPCDKKLGYTCKCKDSLCGHKRKPEECTTIKDCVKQGKCTASKPCACTQGYCTLPWWVDPGDQDKHCRNSQDCEASIMTCRGGQKCECVDLNDEGKGMCLGVPFYIDQQ